MRRAASGSRSPHPGWAAITVDDSIAVPQDYTDELRSLVAGGFSDTMFFDDTKHVMISIEQRQDVSHTRYVAAQPAMNEAAFELLVRHGLGGRLGDREGGCGGASAVPGGPDHHLDGCRVGDPG